MSEKGIEVTAKDLDTGQVHVIHVKDDFIIICQGTCYVDGKLVYSTGTVQLTIKGRAQQ